MSQESYNTVNSSKNSFGSELFFWGFAVLALFFLLGYNALWESEERWAEISREMLISGNWLHPAMNWVVYFDKPHLTYWLILPFLKLFGNGSELAIRIPGALAALAALWGTRRLAFRLCGAAASRLSGWVLLSCYAFLFWGRTAAADMFNLTAIILAVAWFYEVESKAKFFHYLIFYLVCFGGALGKGLPALVMPIAFVLPGLLVSGRWKKHLKIANFAAMLIGAILFFLPFLLSAWRPVTPPFSLCPGEPVSGLELVWRENILRVFQPFDHKDPVYSYLYNLPRCLLPWTPFFLLALAGLCRNWRERSSELRYVVMGMGVMFLLYTASGSRRWYYILPLMPFASILIADVMLRGSGFAKIDKILSGCFRYGVIVGASFCVAALIARPVWSRMVPFPLPPAFLWIVVGAGLLVLVVMFLDNQPRGLLHQLTGLPSPLAGITLSVAIAVFAVFSCILPVFTSCRTEKPFLLNLKRTMEEQMISGMLCWGGPASPKLLFYFDERGPVPAVADHSRPEAEKILTDFLNRHRGRRVAVIGRLRRSRKTDDPAGFIRTPETAALEKALHDRKIAFVWNNPDQLESLAPLEKRTARKIAVWFINIPSKNKESVK